MEKQAAKTLLNEGSKIGINWMGREWKFSVKPLKLGTIIKISKHSSALGALDADDAIASLLKSHKNIKLLCNVVACGLLNSRFKLRFSSLFAWWLQFQLTPKELHSISLVIAKNMSVEDFFFTTRLIGGLNLLTTNHEEEKQSGEALQGPPKHTATPSMK